MLYVPCLLNNVPIAQALVDTGSTISLIHSSICNHFDTPPILEPPDIHVTSVNSQSVSILGVITCSIKIDDSCMVDQPFYVASDIGMKVVLGADFLSRNQAVVRFSPQCNSVAFQKTSDRSVSTPLVHAPSAQEIRVCLIDTVELPPNHTCTVRCKLSSDVLAENCHA